MHTPHTGTPLTWRCLQLALAATLALTGCTRRPRHAGEQPSSPQAALEEALIRQRHAGTRRTGDGGIIYTAQLLPGSPELLRLPYDLLKLECENHSASFARIAAPARAAASLATDPVPDPIHALLAEADQRQLFGHHRCEAGSNVWVAEIEPHALVADRRWQLQVYVHASLPDEADLAAPAGPGLPALADAQAKLPPPSTAPAASAAPLDRQAPRPPVTGDRILAEPRPFGLTSGVDSPEILAKKLSVELERAKPCDSPKLRGYCWDQPSSDARSLRAAFVDLGAGPVLAELELQYPADAHSWLIHTFQNQFGPPDDTNQHDTSWSWVHTTVQVSWSEAETRVRILHKPSLDRAQLPSGAPGREPSPGGKVASPWQLQLGYEPAQAAQKKLRAAGFSIAKTGCADGGPYAQPVFTRTCPLTGGNMPGSRGAWVRNVDIGDGKPRLAELGYTLDKSALAETLKDLKEQYGEPIPSAADQLQWWTGPVGITLTPGTDTFTLRYYHGRLLQYFIVAEAKRQAADKAIQRQGL